MGCPNERKITSVPATKAELDGFTVRRIINDRRMHVCKKILDEICNPSNVSLPHEQPHGVHMKQPRVFVLNALESRAFKDQVSLVTNHRHLALLAHPFPTRHSVAPAPITFGKL